MAATVEFNQTEMSLKNLKPDYFVKSPEKENSGIFLLIEVICV